MKAFDVGARRTASLVPVALIAAAFAFSLFFNGIYLQYLALAQIALLVAAAWIVFRGYNSGFAVPRSPLPVAITLFWIWLAISISWSQAWYLSFLNLWWIGSIALVFWLGLLAPDPERWWRWIFGFLLALTTVLVVYALIQLVVWHQDARATFLNRNSFAALLNLMNLPLAAALLVPQRTRSSSRGAEPHAKSRVAMHVLGWVLLFAGMLVVALTKSRGAILSLAAGLILLLVVVTRVYGWRRALAGAVVFGGALLVANIEWHGVVLDRLGGLDHPITAGATRFVIWRQAWELVEQHPLSGIGLGTFWLSYPAIRAPGDTSAGFYVHNDYFQLWIEVGLPGLLLWLGVIGAALHQFVGLWRAPTCQGRDRVLAAGAFGGLMAIGLHSLFTFNLYLLPIDIVAGVVLARLQMLAVSAGATGLLHWRPADNMTARGFRTLVVLIAAIPISHFGGLTWALNLVDDARADLGAQRLVAADRALSRAEILAPGVDTTWCTHAEMLTRSVRLLAQAGHEKQRRILYKLALAKLAQAQALNPLRPQVYKVRGDLYAENSALAGPDALGLAEAQYRKALAYDPRSLPTREALAGLLAAHGELKEASSVLMRGLEYWQPYSPGNAHYAEQTAAALSAAGDMSTRAEVLRRFRPWLNAARMRSGPKPPSERPTSGMTRAGSKN